MDVKERTALFKGLVISLVKYGKIHTTVAKAGAIKGLVDKLVSKAKKNTVPSTRSVYAFFGQKDIVNKLVTEIAPRFKNRNGGTLRMLRTGRRSGDGAEVVSLEWTEKETVIAKTPVAKKASVEKQVKAAVKKPVKKINAKK